MWQTNHFVLIKFSFLILLCFAYFVFWFYFLLESLCNLKKKKKILWTTSFKISYLGVKHLPGTFMKTWSSYFKFRFWILSWILIGILYQCQNFSILFNTHIIIHITIHVWNNHLWVYYVCSLITFILIQHLLCHFRPSFVSSFQYSLCLL